MDSRTLASPGLRMLARLLALVWGGAVSWMAFTFFREGDAPLLVQALAFLPLVVAVLALAWEHGGGTLLAVFGPAILVLGGWYLAQHVKGNKLDELLLLAVAALVPVFAGWVLLSSQEVRHPYRIQHTGGH